MIEMYPPQDKLIKTGGPITMNKRCTYADLKAVIAGAIEKNCEVFPKHEDINLFFKDVRDKEFALVVTFKQPPSREEVKRYELHIAKQLIDRYPSELKGMLNGDEG